MARPQEFDQQQVLDQAMQLFWRKGYANTSIKDLTEVTELQPGSLYAAYKNKRNLFVLSLDFYFDNLFEAVRSILESTSPPLNRIRQFFDFLISQKIEDKQVKSCLLVNTLLEIPLDDGDINPRVVAMFQRFEQLFENALREAQETGDLADNIQPQAMAKMLMSGVIGIQVYNRMQPGEAGLRQIVDNLLATLSAH